MHIDDLALEIEICAFCPLMCKDMSSFHQHAKGEDSAPHIVNLYLWKVLEARNDSEREDALKQAAEVVYQSALDGQSSAWCAKSRDIRANLMAARADVVEHGYAPKSVVEIDDKTKKQHNPFGEPHDMRLAGLDGSTRSELEAQKSGKIGLWLGCTAVHHHPEIVQALVKILTSANVDFQILGEDEWCCGLPQYKLGLRETARQLAEHNVQAIERKGFETLIVDCPECYRAFREFYPAWGQPLKARVVHSVEYVQELLAQGKLQLKGALPKTVTYHDPCELAIHSTPIPRRDYETSDICEAPRDVLRQIPGISLKEMRWTRTKTYCCGGGVGMRESYPEVSRDIGKKVLHEASETGAEVLAVGCPKCKRQFSWAMGEDASLEVSSIVELVAQCI